ncbi:protein plastid transcriptionally active 12, chloroplastic [Tanacetum coccineum]|uniref:Protein plastid transcriptionally active 12, chloroplastic n=1 Tax=Tanacetum coccineum TaxID=301880 RepID=A0ABQ5HJT1_9ASTR
MILIKKTWTAPSVIDPKVRKLIKEPLTSEELWWNWRKLDKEQWSRWQKKRPDAETVFLKAMAETGQIKLYGEQPTLTETALYRARKHLYKEETRNMKDWEEMVHTMCCDDIHSCLRLAFLPWREYRVMMGTDHRISRDPLAMRMKEEPIKQSYMMADLMYAWITRCTWTICCYHEVHGTYRFLRYWVTAFHFLATGMFIITCGGNQDLRLSNGSVFRIHVEEDLSTIY